MTETNESRVELDDRMLNEKCLPQYESSRSYCSAVSSTRMRFIPLAAAKISHDSYCIILKEQAVPARLATASCSKLLS